MEILEDAGGYRGELTMGATEAPVEAVETGAGHMQVRVRMATGTLILRLAGDGDFMSGNWVLGARRGAVVATRTSSPTEEREGKDERFARHPVRTGRSSLPPHSAHDPS